MASSASEIIAAICPGLAADSSLAVYLDMATTETDAAFFGVYYQRAVALRASHMWALAQRYGGDAGAIASKSEGGLSVSYGAVAGAALDFGQTNYGIQLQGLINSIAPAMSVTGIPFIESEDL